MMPRDVATRWNSTFDMLNFAIDYRAAIDAITSNRDLNLRKYELEDNEWVIAVNLRDTLKVCTVLFYCAILSLNCRCHLADIQACHPFFLA
jgi:hypothetical protein